MCVRRVSRAGLGSRRWKQGGSVEGLDWKEGTLLYVNTVYLSTVI